MKNKRKQFESLKNKLKNLYFKKSLNVVKKQNSFKLSIEKANENLNLSPDNPSKLKKESIISKEIKPVNIVKNISRTIKNYITSPIIKKYSLNFTNSKNTFTDNTNKKNYQLYNTPSENAKETSTPQYKNTVNKSEKNVVVENTHNKFTTNQLFTSNTENSKIYENTKKIKNIVNKNNKNIRYDNNISSTVIKFIETPAEIKRIKENTIINNKSLDTNQFYFPSKTEFISLKKMINNRTDNNLSVINNNNENKTQIVKNKVLYALPAYKEGSGIVNKDVIAKIHKNEMVLSEKEIKSLKGNMKGVVKTEKNLNLAPTSSSPPTAPQSRPSGGDYESLFSNSENTKTTKNDQAFTSPLEMREKELEVSEYLNTAIEIDPIDKNFNIIEDALEPSYHLSSDKKSKSLPVWRATMG
jgi:hypothetical protein